MKKFLLVISNHNPANWALEQKQGWDKIQYVPFPNILPDKTREEIKENEVVELCNIIGNFYSMCDEENAQGFINLQGEFTTCYEVFMALAGENVRFVFPTTERVVQEIQKEDGSTEKKAIFKFVMWR